MKAVVARREAVVCRRPVRPMKIRGGSGDDGAVSTLRHIGEGGGCNVAQARYH